MCCQKFHGRIFTSFLQFNFIQNFQIRMKTEIMQMKSGPKDQHRRKGHQFKRSQTVPQTKVMIKRSFQVKYQKACKTKNRKCAPES